jgi:hypothetical protein
LLFPKGLATGDEIRAAISDFVMNGLSANATPKRAQGKGAAKRRPVRRKRQV